MSRYMHSDNGLIGEAAAAAGASEPQSPQPQHVRTWGVHTTRQQVLGLLHNLQSHNSIDPITPFRGRAAVHVG